MSESKGIFPPPQQRDSLEKLSPERTFSLSRLIGTGSDSISFAASNFVRKNDSSRIEEAYSVEKKIGEGAYGEVHKLVGKRTTSGRQERVSKKVKKRSIAPNKQQEYLNEIEVLRQLDHPNILKIYEYFEDEEFYHIVTEFCGGGDLFDQLTRGVLEEVQAAGIARQILSALQYAHKRGIVHRDLKSENVMVDNQDEKDAFAIKVIDWGLAGRVTEDKRNLHRYAGTIFFMAPEVIRKKYNEKCDIWSCGVIIFEMLSGSVPLYLSEIDVLQKIRNGEVRDSIGDIVKYEEFIQLAAEKKNELLEEYRDKILEQMILNFRTLEMDGAPWQNVSDEAKDLLRKMLDPDADRRLTAQQCLEHPWLSGKGSHGLNFVSQNTFKKTFKLLRDYRPQRKLQQAAHVYIATNFAQKQEQKYLVKVFQELDTNGDGVLQREELIEGYLRVFGDNNSSQAQASLASQQSQQQASEQQSNSQPKLSRQEIEKQVDEMLAYVDTNQSGTVDYSEFITACYRVSQQTYQKNLEEAFRVFDRNGDGKITIEELKETLGEHLTDLQDDVWQEVINEVDANGDKEIDLPEFLAMVDNYVEIKSQQNV